MGLKTYAQKMCIQCAHLWCREVPKHVEVQCLRPRQRRITNVRSITLIMIELGSLDHSRTACTLSWPSLQNSVSMVCPCLTISKPSLWFVKGHYVNSTNSYSFHLLLTSIFFFVKKMTMVHRWRYVCSSRRIWGLSYHPNKYCSPKIWNHLWWRLSKYSRKTSLLYFKAQYRKACL